MKPKSDAMGRRAFLWTAVVSAVAAVCGEWWAQRRVSAGVTIAPFRIAADVPPGTAVNFTLPGTTIPGVLVRLNDDEYAAFDQRCPHLGCPVQWSAARERFECPCHRAVFDGPNGRLVSGPPRRGLRRIRVECRGSEVWGLPAHDEDEDDDDDERSA